MIDTTYLSELDLQTLGEDRKYYEEVLDKKPQVFFRIGDRTSISNPRFWPPNNQKGFIGFIKEYGSHDIQKPPVFIESRIPVRIISREARKLKEVTLEELHAAYKEIGSHEALVEWLSSKYPNEEVHEDSILTVYVIEYIL
ncbi:hypothetical protein JXR01_02170 [Candidatus Kaiserbacteria bacterium]|nr:MAG: hypothetical protein JXR01_02170 [Candidatus Kaiserbacteria bacterium]